MNSMTTGLICTGCVFGGALLGMWLSTLLPDHHLRGNSKDAVKVGGGMIATLTALILGLLVGSAKSSFDLVQNGITQSGAKINLIDRVLTEYGPEAKAVREQLRRSVAAVIEMVWPNPKTGVTGLTKLERASGVEVFQSKLRELAPQTDTQRVLLAQALQLSNDVSQTRWLLIEQEQSALPTVLLVILVFWLTMLHLSIGLFAERNATVIIVLLIGALSVSAAIFLILEMNHPLEGMIQVSGAPMRKALELIGQ